MILGIDAGNYETKVCVDDNVYSFPSDIGEYRDRKLTDKFSDDDIIWEYNGQKGFAGTLAKYESEFGGTIKGKTKNHLDATLRVLISVHKYGSNDNDIIIGQPIDYFIEEEKRAMKRSLRGNHEITVNGVKKKFRISNIEVAPEGSSAFLSNPEKGLVRIIDIGSGTTNFATIMDLKRIDKDSFTEKVGMEIIRTKDANQIANKIYRIVSGVWNKDDLVYLTGGGANKVYSHLIEYLPNCEVLKPKIGSKFVRTKYGNVIGFYKIAKGLFGNEY